MVEQRWQGEDLDDERMETMNGALEVILGDATMVEIVAGWRAALAAERVAHRRMTGALMAASLDTTERALAERAGVTRMTLRKALGKG